MNMVNAFVNAANTYRDGTYCGTVPTTVGTVGTVQLYLGATMHRSPLGTIHWCTR